jgi:hypothetical protein
MSKAPTSSYTSSKLQLKACPEKGGFGLFAIQPIQAGEVLCVWGGEVVSEEELDQQSYEKVHHGIQIEEKIYLLPLVVGDPADYVNHSCDPNAGLNGQITLVAMRDIADGDEICFDYAMSDSTPYDEFECHCGSPKCRRFISGNDWKNPELQRKYKGYFMPYIQRRIDQSLIKSNGHKQNTEAELALAK